jgi:hypothetical protein
LTLLARLIVLMNIRFYPGGKATAEGQIVVYQSTFNVTRSMMRCTNNVLLRSRETTPPGTYSCRLEEDQTELSRPREGLFSCLGQLAGVPFRTTTPCALEVDVKYPLMSLNEFKDMYWK